MTVLIFSPVLFCPGEGSFLQSTGKYKSRFIWASPEFFITCSESGLFNGVSLRLQHLLVFRVSVCMHECVSGVMHAKSFTTPFEG